jgi:hypothetical protein
VPTTEDELEAADQVDDDVDEDLEEAPVASPAPQPPLLRSKDYKPEHRQPAPPKTERASGSSWWLNKGRDDFSKAAQDRVADGMGNTKEGRSLGKNLNQLRTV